MAVRVNPTVTSANNPYGTLATMIPIAKMKLVIAGYPIANPKQKRTIPQTEANIVIPTMNLPIYLERGDYYPLALAANVAIWPMNVRSPVYNTNPIPFPYPTRVEKKAIFFVYKGLSLFVHSAVLERS